MLLALRVGSLKSGVNDLKLGEADLCDLKPCQKCTKLRCWNCYEDSPGGESGGRVGDATLIWALNTGCLAFFAAVIHVETITL